MNNIEESCRMLAEIESELKKVKNEVFDNSDIDGKLQMLKSEIENMNITKKFEMIQKNQMLSLIEAMGHPIMFDF